MRVTPRNFVKTSEDIVDGAFIQIQPNVKRYKIATFHFPKYFDIDEYDDTTYRFTFSQPGEKPVDKSEIPISDICTNWSSVSYYIKRDTQFSCFVSVPIWCFHQDEEGEVCYFKLNTEDIEETQEEDDNFFYSLKYEFFMNKDRTQLSNMFQMDYSSVEFMLEYDSFLNEFELKECSYQTL
jgi:hypothetical protein